MKCPVCSIDLVLSERQGIEIDYCPTCRGVWLDRGELDKILERSQAGSPHPGGYRSQPHAPQHPSYQQGHGGYHDHKPHGYGHHHKKKKSFLSEIFDFD